MIQEKFKYNFKKYILTKSKQAFTFNYVNVRLLFIRIKK